MKHQIKKPSENRAVKILERKGVIRLFGLALLLAPFMNAALVIWMKKVQVTQPLNFFVLSHLFASGTWTQKTLTLASLVIGVIMLFGSLKAWKFVLVLLGCHILIQITNLGHDLRENWLWGPFFLVNISIFFFIADQLVFKLKITPTKNSEAIDFPTIAKKITIPSEVMIKNKIMVHFDQFGPWGQLKSVSEVGLHIHCLNPPLINFEQRELELSFKNGLNMKSRFKTKKDQDFFFEFINVTTDRQKLLAEWIHTQSA